MRVVYVTTNGLATPHVQSQVIPYLQRLSSAHDFVLATHERPGLAVPTELVQAVEDAGMAWHRLRYRGGLWGSVRGAPLAAAAVKNVIRDHGAELLHARSYVPAEICRRAARGASIPWLFDMRGFYVDERVDLGLLAPGGFLYRILKAREARLLADADGIVVLTRAAQRFLRSGALVDRPAVPLAVIPCAVNLERFAGPVRRDQPPVLLYAGSIGPRYDLQSMAKVVAAWMNEVPEGRFKIASQQDPASFLSALDTTGVPRTRVDFERWVPAEVAGRLLSHDAMLSLVVPGLGSRGSSPIKVSEALAAGMPLVVDRACGDMAELLASGDVAVEGGGNVDPADAVTRLCALMARPRITEACRARAREWYDLDEAIAKVDAVYRHLGNDHSS